MSDPLESAGTENTETAESTNTGGGVAEPENAAANKQQLIARGIEIARSRLLKEFGVESFDELRARLTQPEVDDEPAPAEPVQDSKEFRGLAKQLRLANNRLAELEKQAETLRAQADQARVEKLKAAALARGVGAGRQVEAFVKLFGDRVKFDDQQELAVLSKMQDGSLVDAGQTLDEFMDEVLPDAKFLLAPTGAPRGAGSQSAPTQEPAKRRGFGALEELRPAKK